MGMMEEILMKGLFIDLWVGLMGSVQGGEKAPAGNNYYLYPKRGEEREWLPEAPRPVAIGQGYSVGAEERCNMCKLSREKKLAQEHLIFTLKINNIVIEGKGEFCEHINS